MDRLAAALRRSGVKRDDVVLVQLPNVGELALAYLACLQVGAIACPLPVQYRGRELSEQSKDVDPTAFVTAERMGDQRLVDLAVGLERERPGLAVLAFGDALPEGVVAFDAEPPAAPGRWAEVDANAVFTICWTSGTESFAKGCPRTHNDWQFIACCTVDGVELTHADVLLCPFPMVNMAGLGGMLVPWLVAGCSLAMHQPFDVATFLKQVAVERITYTVAPPALLNMLLARDEILAHADLSSLRAIGSGSAPLTPWMVRGWKDKHGLDVTNFFGSNEGVALLGTPKDIPDPDERALYFPRYDAPGATWAGRVPQAFRTRLCDLETGEALAAPGRAGELRIKGPTVFSGYWHAKERGLEGAFDDEGWFRTGDVFELAGDGDRGRYYRFVDRCKDIINRSTAAA